jgi:hypothetical protein
MKIVHGTSIRLLLVVVALFGTSAVIAQVPFSQDPGSKGLSELSGVKFSIPKYYDDPVASGTNLVIMRRKEYNLALFVSTPQSTVDENSLTDLATRLAQTLYPKEASFKWKALQSPKFNKISDFQTGDGVVKGITKDKTFVQMHYATLRKGGNDVIVGYMTYMGKERDPHINPDYLFRLDGPGGMSMPGWYAQAHIIASVTGEKYERINPGSFLRGVPVKN